MRRQYRMGTLPQERIDILESMGFQWRLRKVKVPGGRHNPATMNLDGVLVPVLPGMGGAVGVHQHHYQPGMD